MKLFVLDAENVSEEDISLVRARFPRRYERAMRLVKNEDRLASIAAGALLWRVLGADESMIITAAEGRPYLAEGPEFSLSHSRGRCVLAVSDTRIGVDIEWMDESDLIAAGAALTEAELEWIAPDPLERFHILWTRKESIYKAVGGFEDPRDIEALDGRLPAELIIKSTVAEGFALSVCSQAGDTEQKIIYGT